MCGGDFVEVYSDDTQEGMPIQTQTLHAPEKHRYFILSCLDKRIGPLGHQFRLEAQIVLVVIYKP